MGQFQDVDFNVASKTVAELDHIALEDGGVVGSIGGGFACRKEPPVMLAGGWSARWINKGGVGNQGVMILVPTTSRTRTIHREGRIRRFMAAGLTYTEAESLYHADARYKEELVGAVVWVLMDRSRVMAMMAHPGMCGPGSGRTHWQDAWGEPIFGKDGLKLSAPREAELAKMVKAICR